MKKLDVAGSGPALVTPFNDDDEVDNDIQRSLVDFQVDDITTVYMESHPILSVGEPDDVRCYDIFSKMFKETTS